jgi:peptidoglycan hydrolase-like protein with peptidoglycan-binding domain
MAISKEAYILAYARQQQILTYLGYYGGHIDGIWGPKTIEAKKAFESSGKFKPGIPNSGSPFSFTPPFPHKLSLDADYMMHIIDVEDSALPPVDDSVAELVKQEREKVAPVEKPVAKVDLTPGNAGNPLYKENDLSVNVLLAQAM